jgi:molybdenum cofactor synthesis domain-containing protein
MCGFAPDVCLYPFQQTEERSMTNPTAAMLVIGDEILSGRTRDSNLHYLAQELTRHGINLAEARVVSDEQGAIVAAVNGLRGQFNHVFTSGGIGPTHDDITPDAIAAAFGVGISHRADAMALLGAHYERQNLPFNEARMRMARIPDGARLIDNPVSIAPGFSLDNVHVMAGVPRIFEAMVASVLPNLTGGAPLLSQTLRLLRGEGEIAEPFGALAAEYPDLSMGSYPFTLNGAYGTNLVIRGTDAARIDAAMARLAALFIA